MKPVKSVYGWIVTMVAVLGFTASAQAMTVNAGDTREVLLSVGDVYVPSGFDSSSEAFVVVSGMLPNTCYSWKGSTITNLSPTEHEIKIVASVKEGLCAMMIVLFQHEVPLGHLVSGKHLLRFIGGDGTYVQKQMTVE